MSVGPQQSIPLDLTIGAAAVTTLPLWMQYLQNWVGFAAVVGGAALLTLRIIISAIELRNKVRAGGDRK